MQNIQKISTDLFNKLRGRFDQITIGDESGTVTNTPDNARFFDFAYTEGKKELGKVSVSINEEDKLTVIFSKDFITAEDSFTQKNWYNFLKELRQFAKKRMLEFDVRDINKSNLTKRDYKFLAKQSGDENMNESKMYGTSRVSYQNVDEARIVIKHTENINQELNNRTQKIGSIYIESNDGERFKYPYRHLNGARAMARHVAEGGKPYDEFGKHITSLSEELSKLKKFTSYMGRSAVMAESLAEYTDVVKGRIKTVKKTIESLQKKKNYTEAFSSFESPVLEDVPSDVAENWIDQLTVRQFNEELKDVFPYIYKLVSEATKATELGPDDLVDESALMAYAGKKKHGAEYMKKAAEAGRNGASQEELGRLKDKYSKAEKTPEEIQIETAFEKMMGQFSEAGQEEEHETGFEFIGDDGEPAYGQLLYTVVNGQVDPKSLRGETDESDPRFPTHKVDSEFATYMVAPGGDDHESALNFAQEDYKEKQAGNESVCSECGNPSYTTLDEKEIEEAEKKGLYYYVNKRKKAGTSRSKNHPDAPSNQDWKDAAKTAKEEETNEEKKKGSHGKVCWKGYRRGKGNDCHKMEGVMKDELIKAMEKIAADDSGNLLYKALSKGAMGPDVQNYLQDMYNDVAIDHGLHPDDDHDDIEQRMWDQIEQDYGMGETDNIETDEKKQKTPLGEFILSYFDREQGAFPKGETAVLTMVEKDYGERFIEPAKAFIEQIQATYEEIQMRTQPQQMEVDTEFERMRELAGLR